MGPSPTDGPVCHPGGKRYQMNLHTDLTASQNPPLPQYKERDGPPSRFFPDLRREHSLLTHLLLSVPPPRTHPGHPRLGRSDSTITSPDPSIFPRTRERPAAANEVPSPPLNGTASLIKRTEAGKLLDQRVHVLTSTKELQHLTRNFVKLSRDYLVEESPICLFMGW